MQAFPFSADDWVQVSEIARDLVNAGLSEDSTLGESRFEELRCLLSELQSKYGRHPILVETEADFTQEPQKRLALYEEAIHIARANGLLSYTICLSLARLLLEDLDEPERALKELSASDAEVATHADQRERQEWEELRAGCARRLGATG